MFLKKFISVLIVVVISFSLFLLYRHSAKGEIAFFYPKTCLGGWVNPHNAENKPESDSEAFVELNKENSAFLEANTLSEIFCGDFTGEIVEDSVPKKIILTFSWEVAKELSISNENTASTTPVDSATSTATTTESVTSPVQSTDQSADQPTDKPSVIPVVAPVDTPSTTTPLPEEASPVSFGNFFATKVFAQENQKNSAENYFLEVSYSLDGQKWVSLGSVDQAHLRYSIFEIPLPEHVKWSDLKHLQISVKSLSSLDKTPGLYLDGMTLQVTYGKADENKFISESGFYIPEARAVSSDLDFQIRNNDKVQELVVKGNAPLGNVVVFNASTTEQVLTTHVEAPEYILQPEYFGKGNYVFITTDDPNGCSSSTLDSCRAGGGYKYEGIFTVDGPVI